MMSVWLLVLVVCVPSTVGQLPNIEHLRGIRRLDGVMDHYFSCHASGRYLQWEYVGDNNILLTGFETHDVGIVRSRRMRDFRYTLALLSYQGPGTSQYGRLDSVLVIHFSGNHSRQFEVFCSNNRITSSVQVEGLCGNISGISSSSDGSITLQHILSSNIVLGKKETHIFVCTAQHEQLFYDTGTYSGGFSESDSVNTFRQIPFQDNMNIVNILYVLKSRGPTTSLFIYTGNFDVNITCFSGNSQAQLSSGHTDEVESSDMPYMPRTINQTNKVESSLMPQTTHLTLSDRDSSSSLYRTEVISSSATGKRNHYGENPLCFAVSWAHLTEAGVMDTKGSKQNKSRKGSKEDSGAESTFQTSNDDGPSDISSIMAQLFQHMIDQEDRRNRAMQEQEERREERRREEADRREKILKEPADRTEERHQEQLKALRDEQRDWQLARLDKEQKERTMRMEDEKKC